MRFILLIVVTSGLFGCRRSEEIFTTAPERGSLSAASLKACPNGHSQLVETPIVYGLLTILTKDKSEWNDKEHELARKLDAKEVIWGGCCVGVDKNLVSCKTCGFRACTVSPQPGGQVFWSRNGRLLANRDATFTKFGASFPVPIAPTANTELNSDQTLVEGEILSESISFRLPMRERQGMISRIRKWAETMKLQIVDPPDENIRKLRFISSKITVGNADRVLQVDLMNSDDGASILIRLLIGMSYSPLMDGNELKADLKPREIGPSDIQRLR